MTENLILISILSTVSLGVFFATILAIAYKTLKVEEDPKIIAVEEILPGLNCGACGYAGCQSFAIAVTKGEAPTNGCLAGGKEITDKLAELLGTSAQEITKRIAILHCNANDKERTKSAIYKGIATCVAANIIKGVLNCSYGCLGFGDCASVCPFDAISMVEGLPKVDPNKCTSCGKCVQACPRQLYSIEEHDGMVTVACSSLDKGPKVRKTCSKGCIACGICAKLSEGVFKVEDNLARIDYGLARSKQIDWTKIMGKCPTKVITRIGG